MTKRKTLAAALALASVFALAACGSNSAGSTSSSAATVPFYTDKASWKPQFEDMSAASKTANGFGIKFTGYSDENAYQSFIKQAFRTSDKPTLFTWGTGDSLKQLVDAGLLQDTTDQWQAAIKDGDVPKDLAKYYTYDGKQYCAPLNMAYWVMYYNKKVFAEHNLTPPTTWAELMTDAKTLKDAGVTPFYQTNSLFSFAWFQTILAGENPKAYQGLADGSVKFTDPAVVHAMKTWGDMMKDGYFSDPGVATEPNVMLQNGDVAMLNFGSFMTGQLTQIGMKEGTDYGTFAIPAVDPSLSKTPLLFETGPLCQAKGGKAADNATTFTKWWFGESAQNTWAKTTGGMSFNPKATVYDKGLDSIQQGVGKEDYQLIERFYDMVPAEVLTAALDGFGQYVSSPTDDPTAILKTIQQAADSYWAGQK